MRMRLVCRLCASIGASFKKLYNYKVVDSDEFRTVMGSLIIILSHIFGKCASERILTHDRYLAKIYGQKFGGVFFDSQCMNKSKR